MLSPAAAWMIIVSVTNIPPGFVNPTVIPFSSVERCEAAKKKLIEPVDFAPDQPGPSFTLARALIISCVEG